MSRRSNRVAAGATKYAAVIRAQFVNALAYPGELLARCVSIALFMWVFLHLWRATYASTGQDTIAGLSLADTLWYLVLAESIVLSQPRLSQQIAESVRDGSIATVLNKPYNFLLYYFGVSAGDSLPRFFANLAVGGAIVWAFAGPPPVTAATPLVMVTVLAAWAINFCVVAAIGLAAFVTEEVSAFEWIYSKFVLLLGGVLIPLDFFPDLLRQIAGVLPFAYTVYAPARLFVTPSLEGFAAVLAGQLAWLAVLATALALLFRRSVTWLTINGG